MTILRTNSRTFSGFPHLVHRPYWMEEMFRGDRVRLRVSALIERLDNPRLDKIVTVTGLLVGPFQPINVSTLQTRRLWPDT